MDEMGKDYPKFSKKKLLSAPLSHWQFTQIDC